MLTQDRTADGSAVEIGGEVVLPQLEGGAHIFTPCTDWSKSSKFPATLILKTL